MNEGKVNVHWDSSTNAHIFAVDRRMSVRLCVCRKPSTSLVMEHGYWRGVDRTGGFGTLVHQTPVISAISVGQHLRQVLGGVPL